MTTAPLPPVPSHEETLAAIRVHTAAGTNRFVVKVYRKLASDLVAQHVATFEDVTWAHLVTPENWLQQLWGGGEYRIRVMTPWNDDKTEGGDGIGGLLRHQVPGAPLSVPRYEVMGLEGYTGPQLMTFPSREVNRPAGATAQAQAFQGFASTPLNALGVSPASPPPFDRGLETERRELEMQRRRFEQEQLETRLRLEREAAEQRAATQIAQMKAELQAPKTDLGATMAAVTSAAAPIVALLLESSKQRSEAERESRRLEAEARRQDTERLMVMMAKAMERPTGPDPMVQFALQSMESQTKNNAEMTSRMVEAMGGVSKMAVSMIETVADLNLGGQPEGHPIVDAVKEGVKALIALNSSATTGAKKTARPALPQPGPTQPGPTQPAPAAPAPAHVAARAVPVTHFPKATPPQRQHQQFNGAPEAEAPEAPEDDSVPQAFIPQGDETCVDVMERLIRAKYEPIEHLAAYMLGAQENPDMVAALEEHEGDLSKLCGARLGSWMNEPANVSYLVRLGSELQAQSEGEEE